MNTITNPVNCIGVAGKGLAKSFSLRYPLAQDLYKSFADQGTVTLGRPFLYRDREYDKRVLFFPTKDHWRNPSRIQWIEWGLQFLVSHKLWVQHRVKSLAVPALGCGLGGLDWAEVKEYLLHYLSQLEIPVEIYAPAE